MSILDTAMLRLSDLVDSVVRPIRSRIFGDNNETLDFIMDSFYKLSPEQRFTAMVAGGGATFVLVVGILFFYFSRMDALDEELSRSFNALHELRHLKKEFSREQAVYDQLLSRVQDKTRSLRIKPFFEEKAQGLGVDVQGLNDQKAPMEPENPLGDKMQYVKVEVRLPKISIPRILSYVTTIEKSGNFFSVEDFTVRGRYGTKLYFDGQVKFRGYNLEGL